MLVRDLIKAVKEGQEKFMSKPEQEPVAWRNAAIRVGEDLCSVGPFGYYDMTAEQWLDWALSVVTVHAPPPQRNPWVCECKADSLQTCKCTFKAQQQKPLTNEYERKAFIDWCFSVGLMAQSHGLRSESSDCGTAWEAWQARAAHGIIAPTELKGEA